MLRIAADRSLAKFGITSFFCCRNPSLPPPILGLDPPLALTRTSPSVHACWTPLRRASLARPAHRAFDQRRYEIAYSFAMSRNERRTSHSSSEDHPGAPPDHPALQEHSGGNRKISGPVGGSQGWGAESTTKKTRNRKPSSCVQCRRKKSVPAFDFPLSPTFFRFSCSIFVTIC